MHMPLLFVCLKPTLSLSLCYVSPLHINESVSINVTTCYYSYHITRHLFLLVTHLTVHLVLLQFLSLTCTVILSRVGTMCAANSQTFKLDCVH